MNTFKRILAMPYGTSQQMDLMDAWYSRFMAYRERHNYSDVAIPDSVWRFIHNTDVGYQARRRWTMEPTYPTSYYKSSPTEYDVISDPALGTYTVTVLRGGHLDQA